jgi:hypothetical protein
MKIKMLETKQAAPDGFTIATYTEGEVYDLPQSLAEAFIREKWAVKAKTDHEPPQKNSGAAPENKKRNAGDNRPV